MRFTFLSRNPILLCLGLSILIPFHVYAASFNCNKASNVTEKEICNNPNLSKLDEEIAEQYGKILSLADEDIRKIIHLNQSKWLKLRNSPKEMKKYMVDNVESLMLMRLDEFNNSIKTERGITYFRLIGETSFNGLYNPVYLANGMPGAKVFNNWVESLRRKIVNVSDRQFEVNFASRELFCLSVSAQTFNIEGQHKGQLTLKDETEKHYKWWLPEGRQLNPSDIFNSNVYQELIIKKAMPQIQKEGDIQFIKKQISSPDNWTITRSEFKAVFRPNTQEDAQWIEIVMPWASFNGVLRPEIVALLNSK